MTGPTAAIGEARVKAAPPGPGSPPRALAPLIGRGRERKDIRRLLRPGRLLTLTGPGGSGKTRLALEATADAAPPSGSHWVDLSGTTDPAMVVAAVAEATDVTERPGEALIETLVRRLQRRPALITMDNCEHLIAACAELAATLLRRCPEVALLATSREPLSVEGETTLRILPLPVPAVGARSAEETAAADAVRLFEERAREVRPGFGVTDENHDAVAEICRGLDGIPLAIELAAARVRVLAPAQIAAGLADRFALLTGGGRDAPARQRTLEASLAWSYDLLDEAERLTLARLSVFATDFGLEAAQAVVADDATAPDRVLDLVAALVDRSLLQARTLGEEIRYRMLETIRVYAMDRLAEIDDPEHVRDRHLAYHAVLAARAHDGLIGPDPERWMTRLASSLDDLRAAMDRAITSRTPVRVLEIAEPTFRFWFDRGLSPEMRRRLLAAVDSPAATEEDRVRGLVTAALLATGGADHRAAHAFADRAIPIARSSGTEAQLTLALSLRALSGFRAGVATGEEIEHDVDEVARRAEELADTATAAYALVICGRVLIDGRGIDTGLVMLERSIELCREENITFHLAAAHATSAVWPALTGRVERSREHVRHGLEISQRAGRWGWTVVAMTADAVVDALVGDGAAARTVFDRADATVASRGLASTVYGVATTHWWAFVAYLMDDISAAREAADGLFERARDHGSRWDEAAAEYLLGAIAVRAERGGDARGHLQRCRELATTPRYPMWLGRALLELADLDRRGGDLEEAWGTAHQGLEVLATHGDRVGAADALELIAAIAVDMGDPEHAGRLIAATDRFHEETGIRRAPVSRDRYEEIRPTTRSPDLEGTAPAGTVLTLDEAVVYARRGRGARRRPETGWAALTPAERDVVRLVAEGRTNAEIAERLFVSVNTVKTHLSHVYAKLDVDGRTDLAVQAAERGI